MPNNMITLYFRLPYFHVSNSALLFKIQDSRFKNGLLQFQQKSIWHTFQDWSPSGLICPKYNQIELHNIDFFGTTG